MLDTEPNAETRVPGQFAAPALLVEDLHKSYGATVALAGVDLRVKPGTILGLLGPNGAGKTSLVSIIAGLRRPDAGRVEVFGIDAGRSSREVRVLLGIAPQDTGVYVTLRVRENLRYFAGLAGLRRAAATARIDEVAAALGLDELLDRRGSQLSGGERRRLHTAIALLHRPRLLLLDEPTTGADVQTRGQILELVRGLARDGSAIVYSTHYLPEIEALGADVAFLDRGRVVARGSLAELVDRHGTSSVELSFVGSVPPAARVDGAVVDGLSVRIPAADPAARAAQLIAALGADAGALASIEIVRPSLESVYLAVTGRRYTADVAA